MDSTKLIHTPHFQISEPNGLFLNHLTIDKDMTVTVY